MNFGVLFAVMLYLLTGFLAGGIDIYQENERRTRAAKAENLRQLREAREAEYKKRLQERQSTQGPRVIVPPAGPQGARNPPSTGGPGGYQPP